MHHLRLLAIGLASAILGSCGGDDLVLPSEGQPASITIVQGKGQTGRVGEKLAEPIVVEVLDGADRPVPGATVVVEMSGAVAEPDTLSTGGEGRAEAEITLGSQVGEAGGTVRVIAPESPIAVEATFAVMAVASSANGLAGVSGDGQTAPAGTELPDPLVVEVTDAFGNPIEGVTITWTPDAGSVSQTSTVTDGSGRTSVTRLLGPTSGTQTTLASSEGLAGSPVTFSHTVTAGSASGVIVVSGNNQTAPPGATLPEGLVVQVVDQDGNPVVAAAVTWVVTAGGGTLSPATGATDANGRAATQWTLGASAGTNTAQAIVSGVGEATFSATAAAGTPSEIRVVSGNDQTGQAGTRLPAALVVQVLDDADNPVSGAVVTWRVESGGGAVSPTSGPTGADGQASTSWTLGPGTGGQRVQASTPGAGSVRFDATSAAGAPAALGLATQPSGRAEVGVPFGRQPVVQVRDASGNPVPAEGVTITAAIASGSGQLIGTATQTTGSNGRATFTNLGIQGAVGNHSLIFAASGFTSVTSSTIDVNPVGTTTRITSDAPDPSAPGQGVEVVFTVTSPGGAPSGTVEVTVSGGPETCSAAAAAGRCTIVLNGAGSRTLTARFQGGTLFQASTGTTPHNVVVPNTPPTAVDDGYSATAGVTLSVSEADGVLANDSDPDDPMTAQVLTLPAHGSLTLNPNGSFDYLPNLTYFGQDSFTYQVNAGSATASATVRITVNLPPGP
jgi:adhesin/invasin